MQTYVQDDPFGGFGDWVIPVELGWPPSAHRAVADWQALAEELEEAVQGVKLLTDFDSFKKVKKPVLEEHITRIHGICEKVLDFKIGMVMQ